MTGRSLSALTLHQRYGHRRQDEDKVGCGAFGIPLGVDADAVVEGRVTRC